MNADTNQSFSTGSPKSGDLQVCVLTAMGRGAIASIGVRGIRVEEAIQKFFRPAGGPFTMTPNRIRYGHWCRDGRPELGESIVVCATKPSEAEIHCHGGRAAVNSLVKDLETEGANRVSPFEWLTGGDWRDNATDEYLEAECESVLASCETTKTAAIVLDQCRGALRSAVKMCIEWIEHDDTDQAIQTIKVLIDRYNIGRHVSVPFNVVIAGPPNVGKSSLLNCLLGYERAIAYDQPGTTRDVLTANTSFDGWTVNLVDTAGIRETHESVEREGISLARKQIASADLTLMIADASEGWTDEHDAIDPHGNALRIFNKVDLIESDPRQADAICVSAIHGTGIDQLTRAIVNQLVSEDVKPGEAVPITERQKECLCRSLEYLSRDGKKTHQSVDALHQFIGGPVAMSRPV